LIANFPPLVSSNSSNRRIIFKYISPVYYPATAAILDFQPTKKKQQTFQKVIQEHYYQVTVQQHYMVLETIFNISANQKASLALVAMFNCRIQLKSNNNLWAK
jgi:hypothetical protein